MYIQLFIQLDNNDRIAAAFTGTYISERQDGVIYRLLYHLDEFFVEIKFNIEINEISRVRPFNSPFLLEPYLKDLDINRITQ